MQQESAHYIHDVIVNNSWRFFFFFLFFFKVFWELLEDLAHVLIHAWDCFMKNRLWDLNLSCFYFLKGIEQGFINLWEKQARAIFRSRSIQGSQLSMLFNFVQSQSRIIISKYLRNEIYLKNSTKFIKYRWLGKRWCVTRVIQLLFPQGKILKENNIYNYEFHSSNLWHTFGNFSSQIVKGSILSHVVLSS